VLRKTFDPLAASCRVLEGGHFHPGRSHWGEGIRSILPAVRCDTLDKKTLFEPLLNLLPMKTAKYRKGPLVPRVMSSCRWCSSTGASRTTRQSQC